MASMIAYTEESDEMPHLCKEVYWSCWCEHIYKSDDLASKINLTPPMALAAVRSSGVVLLLFIRSLLLLPLFTGV